MMLDPHDLESACTALRTADPSLASLIDRIGPCRFETRTRRTPFHALLEAIVYQQLSGKAAATIFGRFRSLYAPKRWPTPADVLATPVDRIRGAGLSRAKTLAVQDLAAHAIARRLPGTTRIRRMETEDIINQLTQVRGVGRWTVEMLLIFRLGRPDILPIHDLGIRKGFQIAFGTRTLPRPERVARHGERWRPYRTIASWYLWRAVDTAKD